MACGVNAWPARPAMASVENETADERRDASMRRDEASGMPSMRRRDFAHIARAKLAWARSRLAEARPRASGVLALRRFGPELGGVALGELAEDLVVEVVEAVADFLV